MDGEGKRKSVSVEAEKKQRKKKDEQQEENGKKNSDSNENEETEDEYIDDRSDTESYFSGSEDDMDVEDVGGDGGASARDPNSVETEMVTPKLKSVNKTRV